MALPAVSAGISVVSGVAGLVAKGKQSASQRKQLLIQEQQNYDSTVFSMQRLQNQQLQAEQSYILNDIQFKQSVAQQELANTTQGILTAIETQRQRNALTQQLLANDVNTAKQLNAVTRQEASIVGGASSQRQQSDVQSAQTTDQLQAASSQVDRQLTEEERRQLALRSMLETRSGTGKQVASANTLRAVATALSAGLDIDRNLVESQLQNMNERDLIGLSEQLGLIDVGLARSTVNANQRMVGVGAEAQSQQLAFNERQQQDALALQREQIKFGEQYRNLTEQQARDAERTDYRLMQESLSKTGQSNSSSLQVQQRANSGVNLVDLLATGVNAYAAITPLIKRPEPYKDPAGIKGAPSYNPGVGAPAAQPSADEMFYKDPAGAFGPPSYIPVQRYRPKLQLGNYSNNSGVG